MHDPHQNGFTLDQNVGHAPAGRVTESQLLKSSSIAEILVI